MSESRAAARIMTALVLVALLTHAGPAPADHETALKGLYHATGVEDVSVRKDALMCLQWLSAAGKDIPQEWALPFLRSEDDLSRALALAIIADVKAKLDAQQLSLVISLAEHGNERFAQEVGRVVDNNGDMALDLLMKAVRAGAGAAESSVSSYGFSAASSPLDGPRGLWKTVAATRLQAGNVEWAIEHVRKIRSEAGREISSLRAGWGLGNKEKALALLEYAGTAMVALGTAPETQTAVAFLSGMLSDEWLGSSALVALLQTGQRDRDAVVTALEGETGVNALFVKAILGDAPSIEALSTARFSDEDAFKWGLVAAVTGDRRLVQRCEDKLRATNSVSVASSCAKALIQRTLDTRSREDAASAEVKAAISDRLTARQALTEQDVVELLRNAVNLSQLGERQETIVVLAVCQLATQHLAEKAVGDMLGDLVKGIENLGTGDAASSRNLLRRVEESQQRVRSLRSFDVTDSMERLLVFDVLSTAMPLLDVLRGEGDESDKEQRLKEIIGRLRDTGLVESDRGFVDGVVAAVLRLYGEPLPRLAGALRYTLTRSAADAMLDVAANCQTAADAIQGLAIAMSVPTDELVGLLDDGRDNLRFHVAMTIGQRRDKSVEAKLEEHLARETAPRVRVALRYAICAVN